MVDLPDSVRNRPHPSRLMTATAFRAALRTLDWTQREAQLQLGVSSQQRVNEWCTGKRTVPPYIAAHVHTQLALIECRGE